MVAQLVQPALSESRLQPAVSGGGGEGAAPAIYGGNGEGEIDGGEGGT